MACVQKDTSVILFYTWNVWEHELNFLILHYLYIVVKNSAEPNKTAASCTESKGCTTLLWFKVSSVQGCYVQSWTKNRILILIKIMISKPIFQINELGNDFDFSNSSWSKIKKINSHFYNQKIWFQNLFLIIKVLPSSRRKTLRNLRTKSKKNSLDTFYISPHSYKVQKTSGNLKWKSRVLIQK